MQTIAFSKYEGAGNDFILIDDRSPFFDPSWVPKICDRRFGVGADGVILLQKSATADFRMRIFNQNGTEAESCGNGLRCLGMFISDLGFSRKLYFIEIHDRVVQLSFKQDFVRILMGESKSLQLHLPTSFGPVHFIDTGVPHAVFFMEHVRSAPIESLGPFLRHHPLFGSKGANANLAELQLDGTIYVRTFERGVEGETFSCGTGACAVAAVARTLYKLVDPIKIVFLGGILEISFLGDEIAMSGPANRVFTGFLSR